MKEPSYKYDYSWCTDKDLQQVLARGVREGRELITANREVQPRGSAIPRVVWHMIWKIPVNRLIQENDVKPD